MDNKNTKTAIYWRMAQLVLVRDLLKKQIEQESDKLIALNKVLAQRCLTDAEQEEKNKIYKVYVAAREAFDELNEIDLDNNYLEEANNNYMCCLHETPRTFNWCEENCERYYHCDTVVWANDELNEE